MSICFISNYTKTYFFLEAARLLRSRGYNICWIVVDKKYVDVLQKEFDSNTILHIGKHNAKMPATTVGDFKINELLLTDRVLRRHHNWALPYLENIQQPIYEFLKKQEADVVIGELTWGHELLVYRMVSQLPELGCRYFNPHTIRIPNGRFGFFTDEFQSVLLRADTSESKESTGNDFALAKPSYLHNNNLLIKQKNSLVGLLHRTKAFVLNEHHDDPDDPTRLKKWEIIKGRLVEQWRIYNYRFLVKRKPFAQFANQPFLIYSLHKQPEASIDVMGRYYENQLQNIINIWRILPRGWRLLVKEHTNAIGDRPLSFYRTVNEFEGVELIHEKEDMAAMLRQSQGVFTVSGTVAIEALLQGKRAFTFARNFFNGYGACYHISWEDLKFSNDFEDLCQRLEKSRPAAGSETDYRKFIIDHSFPGIVGDVLHTPGAMDQPNIELVSHAIDNAMRTVLHKDPRQA